MCNSNPQVNTGMDSNNFQIEFSKPGFLQGLSELTPTKSFCWKVLDLHLPTLHPIQHEEISYVDVSGYFHVG